MNIYEHIIDASKNFEIKYELTNEPNFSLKMINHENPWSIKLSEFEYLKNFIIKNDTHCFTENCLNQIENMFDSKIHYVDECRYPNGFNLSYIQRGFDV